MDLQKTKHLIEDSLKGNEQAQGALYTIYAPVLLGICCRYFSNKQEAEDVLHEAWMVIFAKLNQYSGKGSFEGWLKRIVLNKCLEVLKKKPQFTEFDQYAEPQEEEVEPVTAKEKIQSAGFSKEEILAAVQQLPDGFRTVFNLYVFEGLKHREIAKQLGISSGTSKSQLNRAREKIQENLLAQYHSKEEEKKKKKIVSFGLIFMSTEPLKYIDDLAFSELNNLKVTPEKSLSAQGVSAGATNNALFSSLKSATIAGVKVSTFIGGVISLSVLSVVMWLVSSGVFSANEVENQLNAEPEQTISAKEINSELNTVPSGTVAIPIDSVQKEETIKQSVIVKPLKKEPVVLRDTVTIKKKKIIKKRKIIVDTVTRKVEVPVR